MNRQSRRLVKSVRKRGGGPINARALDTVDVMMRGAVSLQESGELEAALAEYNDILELYPDHPDALSNSGYLIAHLGDAESALPRLRRAVELAPDEATIRNNLGTALETAGLLEEAEAELRRAIALNPALAEARVNLGNVFRKLNKTDDADANYQSAFDHAGDDPATLTTIAVAMIGRRQYEPAQESLEKALAIDPGFADALFNRGLLRQYQGNFSDAMVDFRAAIAARQDFSNAHYGLGNALEESGDSEAAIAAYRDAIVANPVHANACLSLSRLLRDEGRINEVVPLLRAAADQNTTNPVVLGMLANLLADGEDVDEAVAVGLKAHALDHDSAPAICSLSKALVEKGLYGDAAKVYGALAAPADAHDVVAHGWLAESLLRHQLFEDGWSIIDRMLGRDELTDRQRYGYLIYKGIHCWLSGDVDGCGRAVDDAEALSQKVGTHNVEKNPLAYAAYLKELIANRGRHSGIYQDAAPDTLHVIGESHCLSPHGTAIDLGGSLYRLESHMIMGCKAWHLADPEENYFQRAYWTIASALPEGANLLVTIGEIDCRVDEGMYPRHQKSQTPLAEIIETTATGFIDFIAVLAANKGQRVNICGVPAPHHERFLETPLPDDEKAVYLGMIQSFNMVLETLAISKGLGFVDPYAMTAGEAGVSDGSRHIDRTHLYPSVLHQALLNA